MESVIRQAITEHLIDNNALSDRQFGFIKGRSSVMQLLKVMDMWTESLESGGQIDVIYTDLEKATADCEMTILLLYVVDSYYFPQVWCGSVVNWTHQPISQKLSISSTRVIEF